MTKRSAVARRKTLFEKHVLLAKFIFLIIVVIANVSIAESQIPNMAPDTIQLLESLKSELAKVRALPIGSYPKNITRPNVKPLIGIKSAEIVNKLGTPDYMGDLDNKRQDLAYFFFNPTPGMYGGGGYALELVVDESFHVIEAKWQLQR